MVFASLNPARETYMLWRRFRMPTQHGPKDAVAVEVKVGNQLISAFTFMLEHIVLLAWSIFVLLGLLISIKKYANDHPSTPLSRNIWKKRASPFKILKLAFRHIREEKSTRWLIVPWLAIAVAFVVVKYTVPIIFAPYIQIGSAAPVRPDTIYVPSRNGTETDSEASQLLNMQVFELIVPSLLRAAGSVESVSSAKKTSSSVVVNQPQQLQTLDNGEKVMSIGYSYEITGLDLGLQKHPDLALNVEGSCVTEYNWYIGGGHTNLYPGAYVDEYAVYNNTNRAAYVSKYDGGPTLAYFFLNGSTSATNTTWSAIVSSVNRSSYSPSTDPWYRTGDTSLLTGLPEADVNIPFMVMPERPALSCWQNDVWSYRGHTAGILHLDTIPNLELPLGIQTILVDALSIPMIYTLGSYLRATALKSSSTANEDIFDAGSSNIFNDLQWLVLASYIATVNTLTETTLYPSNHTILNDVLYNGTLLDGTAEFVIFSNDVVTLGVRSLIIIPTLALALWIIFLVLMFLPIPGKLVAGLSSRKANKDLEKHEPEMEPHHPESQTSHQPIILQPEIEKGPIPEPELSHKPAVSQPVPAPAKTVHPKKEEPKEDSKATKVVETVGDAIQQDLSSDSESGSETNSIIAS